MLRMGLQPLLLLFYPLLVQLLAMRLLRLAQLVLLTRIFRTVNNIPALDFSKNLKGSVPRSRKRSA